MRLARSPSAVIFDLDGTLVDAESWWDEVRASFAAAHGRPWSPLDQAAVMGANSRGWGAIMRRRLDLELSVDEIVDAIVSAMTERYRTHGAPRIPGAEEAVRRLASAGMPMAVASAGHCAVIEAALAGLGIAELFRAVVSADQVARGKPAPDVFLLAAELLGVEPIDCLVVEDSLNGVLAGRAAGMTVVLIPNQAVPPAAGAAQAASLVLDSLDGLDVLLRLPAT
ncbi:MAG: HAD family hydrolase [Candidatus Limnocylindrales bacterium]